MEVKHIWVRLDPETKKIVSVSAMDNSRKDSMDAAAYAIRYLCDFRPFADEFTTENERRTEEIKKFLNELYGIKRFGNPTRVDYKSSERQKPKPLMISGKRTAFPRRDVCGEPLIKPMSASERAINRDQFNELLGKMVAMSKDVEEMSGGMVTQSTYVTEECSELIKELQKKARGKGEDRLIIEEAVDVFASVSVLLNIMSPNIHPNEIEARIRRKIAEKYQRALARWKLGEL